MLLFLVVLGIFAVTLMRKMLSFRVAPSVISLGVCSIGICCLPPSVPAALEKVFETREPFPSLATSPSSDSLGLTLARSGSAGSDALRCFCSCLLEFTALAYLEEHSEFAVGKDSSGLLSSLGLCAL